MNNVLGDVLKCRDVRQSRHRRREKERHCCHFYLSSSSCPPTLTRRLELSHCSVLCVLTLPCPHRDKKGSERFWQPVHTFVCVRVAFMLLCPGVHSLSCPVLIFPSVWSMVTWPTGRVLWFSVLQMSCPYLKMLGLLWWWAVLHSANRKVAKYTVC